MLELTCQYNDNETSEKANIKYRLKFSRIA